MNAQTRGQTTIRTMVKSVAGRIYAPFLRGVDVRRWPPIAARVFGLSVPRAILPNPAPSPYGAANINIILELLDRVSLVQGSVAECGVYRGSTLVPLALHLQGTGKRVFGFDSFQGFTDEDLEELSSEDKSGADFRGNFRDTSYELVRNKLRLFGLEDVQLYRGYFQDSLPKCSSERFSFAHLDCDLYGSYRDCLTFFYPRMNPGGIVLFDEYNDPPWPGCNAAVDEFLAGKSEQLEMIERQNFQKFFFVKS
jgi:O-methyltransferase